MTYPDLRHSYAVASIRAGDDIKTVQGNLGHATAAFTLDVYGHVTDQMKRASAERMEGFIKDVLGL
nr:tyrosine-type recombinase/integrase [Dysosmobacter sp.]